MCVEFFSLFFHLLPRPPLPTHAHSSSLTPRTCYLSAVVGTFGCPVYGGASNNPAAHACHPPPSFCFRFARLIPAMGILAEAEGRDWVEHMVRSHDDGTFFASGAFYTFHAAKA